MSSSRPISIPTRGHHPYAPPSTLNLSNAPSPSFHHNDTSGHLSQTYHVPSLASSAPSNQQLNHLGIVTGTTSNINSNHPRRPSFGATDKMLRRPRRNSDTKRLRGVSASANSSTNSNTTAASLEGLGSALPRDKDSLSNNKGGIFTCDNCGKQYRHPSCLVKHRWEHTVYWKESSKFLLSKHQQVQLLEAAAILVNMEGSARSPGTQNSTMASSPLSSTSATAAGWMGPPEAAFIPPSKNQSQNTSNNSNRANLHLSSSFSQFRNQPVFDEEEEEEMMNEGEHNNGDRSNREQSTGNSSEQTESVKNDGPVDILDDDDMGIIGKMET